MDKFGYIRGKRGPPGPRGKDAVELHTWCPDAVLRMFRETEQCTYYFNTAEDGISKDEGQFALKDRFGKRNAICMQNFRKPVKISKVYGIPLMDSLYKISDIQTATAGGSICFFAFTFKVSSKLTSESNHIFTNETGTRGVTISKKALNILGTDPLELEYNYRNWNTMIIQYSNITEDSDGKCFFVLNGKRGSFLPHKNIKVEAKEVYIGGNSTGKSNANVVLLNFEVYWKPIDSLMSLPLPSAYLVPNEIIQLVKDDMEDRFMGF